MDMLQVKIREKNKDRQAGFNLPCEADGVAGKCGPLFLSAEEAFGYRLFRFRPDIELSAEQTLAAVFTVILHFNHFNPIQRSSIYSKIQPLVSCNSALRSVPRIKLQPSAIMRSFSARGLRPLRSLLSQPISPSTLGYASSRRFSLQIIQSPASTRFPPVPRSRFVLPSSHRQNSSSSRPLTESAPDQQETQSERERINSERRKNEEAYRIAFTCKPCGERSEHHMSKQGYHRGTVLIQCPSCKSRHVMSDHLGVFFDKKTTLEDLLKEKGQILTRGHTDGDLEFWEDGTVKSFKKDE